MTFNNRLTNVKKWTYKHIDKNSTSSEEDKSQDGASKDSITKREDIQKEQNMKMLTQKLNMRFLEEKMI